MKKLRSVPTPPRAQERILAFVIAFKSHPDNDGNSPTYSQIAEGLDTSTSAVYQAVQRMRARGLLKVNQYGKLILPGGVYMPPKADKLSE